MKKPQLEGTVRINAYNVIERAVEEGVAFGWRRAFKHKEAPEGLHEEHVREEIVREVMSALCECLDLGD